MSRAYRKIRKIYVVVIASVLLMTAYVQNVTAAEHSGIGLDDTREVSLSFVFEYSDKEKKTPISGAEFSIYQVAVLESDGRYTMLSEYRDASLTSFEELKTASEMTEAAKEYQRVAQSGQIRGISAVSQENGRVDFGIFTPEQYGVYLVVETGRSGVATEYLTADSFLLQIPEVGEDGEWIYEVIAQPKTSVEKENPPLTPPQTPPETPPTKTPPTIKTGERNSTFWLWMGTAAGLCMIGLLVFKKRRA